MRDVGRGRLAVISWSILRVDVLAQGGIDRCLVFGMLAFEPFQNVGVKPQGHMLFDGTIEFASYSALSVVIKKYATARICIDSDHGYWSYNNDIR